MNVENSSPQSAETASKGAHFPELDALRGIAALTVALFHVKWTWPLYDLGFIRNAYLFVDFFFVLSGFVIAHSYEKRLSNSRDLAKFAWLRFWRVYPVHITFLLAFAFIELLKWAYFRASLGATMPSAGSENGVWTFVSNLSLTHSLGLHRMTTFNYPSWSISAEFYTYLVFAIAVIFLRNIKLSRALFYILIATAGMAAIWLSGKRSLDVTYDLGSFRCIFGFFSGVVVYRIYATTQPGLAPERQGVIHRSWFPAAIFIGVIFFLCLKSPGLSDFLSPLLFSVAILALVRGEGGRTMAVLRARPLVWLGAVSYSLYMAHATVEWVCNQVLARLWNPAKTRITVGAHDTIEILAPSGALGMAFTMLFVIATLALASVVYRNIELPMRNWSRKKFS